MLKEKTFNGKKGQFAVARKTIYWMIAGVIMAVIIIAFAGMIAGYKNKLTAIPMEVKAELIALRFTNIPECFAYMDSETQRISPGSIDLTKFNEEHLTGSCYYTEKAKGYKDFNFKFVLHSGVAPEIHTNNYFGVGSHKIRRNVRVWKDGAFTSDRLTIYVQEKI